MMKSLTTLHGVEVGHHSDKEKLQGISYVHFEKPFPVAYLNSGGTGRIYDSTILDDGKSYPRKHGIFISDGAHAGLESAAYISKALREKGIGFKIGESIIPSITGACVLSLGVFTSEFNPEMGYEVVKKLSDKEEFGNVGAGIGTSIGKFSRTDAGKTLTMKSGVGGAVDKLGNITITALTVLNAIGNVIKDGEILAGNRNDRSKPRFRTFDKFSRITADNSNTTISILGIDAALSQEDLRRIAQIASHGQIRAVKPLNTSLDGDTVFAFSTMQEKLTMNAFGKKMLRGDWYKIGIDMIGQMAADIVQESIYSACYEAETIEYENAYKGIVPSIKDYK